CSSDLHRHDDRHRVHAVRRPGVLFADLGRARGAGRVDAGRRRGARRARRRLMSAVLAVMTDPTYRRAAWRNIVQRYVALFAAAEAQRRIRSAAPPKKPSTLSRSMTTALPRRSGSWLRSNSCALP